MLLYQSKYRVLLNDVSQFQGRIPGKIWGSKVQMGPKMSTFQNTVCQHLLVSKAIYKKISETKMFSLNFQIPIKYQ